MLAAFALARETVSVITSFSLLDFPLRLERQNISRAHQSPSALFRGLLKMFEHTVDLLGFIDGIQVEKIR